MHSRSFLHWSPSHNLSLAQISGPPETHMVLLTVFLHPRVGTVLFPHELVLFRVRFPPTVLAFGVDVSLELHLL